MKAQVKQLQGTPSIIETHYEAMAYWRQEKKICHYFVKGICDNKECLLYKKECIGYTKCSDFISDERFNQKKAKEYKRSFNRKNGTYGRTDKINKAKPVKPLKQSNTKLKRVDKQQKMSENALGNDPRFKTIFEQLNRDSV